jgi:hypothetical protein
VSKLRAAKMHGALAPRALALPRRQGASSSGAPLWAARPPARLRASGARRVCHARAVRVAASAEGEGDAAPGDEASSSGRDTPAADEPEGAVSVLRARLRAVRESPVTAAVVGGGRKVGGWLKALPLRTRKARLRELALAADASTDNAAAEDTYLEALLKHRRVFLPAV